MDDRCSEKSNEHPRFYFKILIFLLFPSTLLLQENLLFASIIAAVDPVAVLNVSIGVNEQIYIVIFGEGLFNVVNTDAQ